MSARLDPGLGQGRRPRPHRARIGQIELPAHLVLGRLAGAEDLDLGPFQALRHLGAGDDDRAAAVADHAAIEPVQRVGDHRRVDDLLDRDDVAQHRMRVVLGMMRSGDLDPGELLAGRAVLVHVAHRAHRVHVRGGWPVGVLERRVGRVLRGARRRAGRLPLAARLSGQGDQRDVALAERDRLGGVPDMDQIGRAAGIGRIHVAQFEAHVIGHRQRPEPRRVAGAEIAVDILFLEAGVFERALGRFGMQLGERFVFGLARRMLIDPDDIGLVLDAHLRLILPSKQKRRSRRWDTDPRPRSIPDSAIGRTSCCP